MLTNAASRRAKLEYHYGFATPSAFSPRLISESVMRSRPENVCAVLSSNGYCEHVRVCVEHWANADVELQATIEELVRRDTTVCWAPAANVNGPIVWPGDIVPRLMLSIRTSKVRFVVDPLRNDSSAVLFISQLGRAGAAGAMGVELEPHDVESTPATTTATPRMLRISDSLVPIRLVV